MTANISKATRMVSQKVNAEGYQSPPGNIGFLNISGGGSECQVKNHDMNSTHIKTTQDDLLCVCYSVIPTIKLL